MDNAGKRVSVLLLLLLAAVVLAVVAVLLFVVEELVMLLMVIKILSLDGCGANRARGRRRCHGPWSMVLVYGSHSTNNLRDPSSLLFCSNVCRPTNSIHTIV